MSKNKIESFGKLGDGGTEWSTLKKIPFAGEKSAQSAEAFRAFLENLDKNDLVVYECLNASNDKAAKTEFLENPDLVHPNNEYGNLNPAQVAANLRNLENAEATLDSFGYNHRKKLLVTILIDDYRKKNNFLAANIAYNNAQTESEKQAAAEQHRKANAELYGEPDEATFYCLLFEKLSKITPETEEDARRLARLRSEIGDIPETRVERFKPKAETVARFSEIIKDFYGSFLDHIPSDKQSFSSQEVVDIINEILSSEFGGANVKYRAILDPSSSNASTNHKERVIKFPLDKTYSRDRASALIVHELGAHVMRAIPYLESDIEAFSTELPGNETFDEGVAKCLEQAISGRYEDSGIDHYINIGLATFKGKNFREVYDISISLKKLAGEKTTTVLNAVQRCFRGTGELPNNKDLAYYNGANKVWKYIEEHIDDPGLMDNLFLSGKANIEDGNQSRLIYEMRTSGLK